MVLSKESKQEFYQALIDKNPEYEGVFYVGVKTTGIFCRPTCTVRKPKFENCEFYETTKEALLASFRPCVRCRPLSLPDEASDTVRLLVAAIEENPEKRWKDQDFERLGLDVSTARRQFKKRFGMTFVEYARSRQMGIAMKQIKEGDSVMSAQLDAGYESSSGFREAFTKIMGAAPTHFEGHHNVLKSSWLDTPLGPMLAIADEESLYLLEFIGGRRLEREIERLRVKTKSVIVPGSTPPLVSITNEIKAYFAGELKEFKTPLHLFGTPFQKLVWEELMRIPYGATRSYADQAKSIGRGSAYRAVANANGSNQIAIVIPCHRIINSGGGLGGYGGGIAHKRWLIDFEHRNSQ